MEKQSFRIVSDLLKIMSKLWLSTKFPHQDIRWNYGTYRSEGVYVQRIFSQYSLSIPHILPQKNSGLWSLEIDLKWVTRRVSSRISRPEAFLRKGILKICDKFTGEQSCRSVISVKLQSNFIAIALQHGCFSLNLLQFFRRHLEQSFFHNLKKTFVDFLMFY